MARQSKVVSAPTEIRHPGTFVPKLSLEERDHRWGLLRERMFVEGVDCLLLVGNDQRFGFAMANVRYLTHIQTYLNVHALFPLVGEPVVWTGLPQNHLPASRFLHSQDWVKDIRPDDGLAAIVDYIKEQKLDKGTIGLTGFSATVMFGDIIPEGTTAYLEKNLPDARIVNATGMVNYMQIIKSPEEIKFLEKAGAIARKTLDTMIQSAEPGRLECDMFADMMHTEISSGGEPQIFIVLSSGPATGPEADKQLLLHGMSPPVIPTTRRLEKGYLIITEFHACYGGYLAGVEFGIFLGKAPDELKRIHEVNLQCSEAVRAALKPGNTFQQVLDAEREPCLKAGMDYVELGFHQHGLSSAGPLTAVFKPGKGMGKNVKTKGTGANMAHLKVRENMVFGTNIDIHDPRWKKNIGLMFGDTIHVMKDGGRFLVNTPPFFEKL